MWIVRQSSPFLLLLILGLFLTSCSSSIASRSTAIPENELGVIADDEFPFSNQIVPLGLWTDGEARVVSFYSNADDPKGTRFFRLSDDGGRTFKDAIDQRKFFEFTETEKTNGVRTVVFNGEGLLIVFSREGDLFSCQVISPFKTCINESVVTPEKVPMDSKIRAVAVDQSRVALVWQSSVRGVQSAVVSATLDGGKTWSASAEIVSDMEQVRAQNPVIALGSNNKLHVAWESWSNAETLVDIAYSYSDDFGKTWSLPRILNDDKLPVWQIEPSIVTFDDRVVVSFSDFREPGQDNDRDWNVYLATSEDGGQSWLPNKRMNPEKEGRQGECRLVKKDSNRLDCFYLDSRNTIFGQLAVSMSLDKGNSWSKASFLTDRHTRVVSVLDPYYSNKTELVFARVFDLKNLNRGYELIKVGAGGISHETEIETAKIERRSYQLGMEIFAEDFEGAEVHGWSAESGIWRIVDRSYVGVHPPMSQSERFDGFRYVSSVSVGFPEKFEVSGRFKYDDVSHLTATIGLRDAAEREFVFQNLFRKGSWLSYYDPKSELYASAQELSLSPARALTENPYSFRSERWYNFKIAFTGDQFDYYVNDEWHYSWVIEDKFVPERLVLSGAARSPTTFDDISVREIK